MSDNVVVMISLNIFDANSEFLQVQQFLDHYGLRELGKLSESWDSVETRGRRWGGSKHPEAHLYGGIYEGLDTSQLMRVMIRINWQYPESVQLFIRSNDAPKFRVFEIIQEEWSELK